MNFRMNNPLNDLDPDLHVNNPDFACNSYTPFEFNEHFQSCAEFSMIHLNARSLHTNFENISNFLSIIKNSFSVIAISETWICGLPVIPFHLDGYKFVNVDRKSGRGGGVGIFIKNDINFQRRESITHSVESDSTCEYLCVDLFRQDRDRLTVGVFYRKPSTDIKSFIHFYSETLEKLSTEKREIIMTGDFNIDLLKSTDENTNDFLNINFSFGLTPVIKYPTRITMNTASLIDNIFINTFERNLESGSFSVELTDHLPIFLVLDKTNLLTKSQHTTINFRRAVTDDGVKKLQRELYEVDWSSLYSCNNVNTAYDLFLSKLLVLYDRNLPLCSSNNKKSCIRKPWITPGLLRYIKKKNKLYKKFLNDRSPSNQAKYKTYRNKVNNILHKVKRKYFCDKLNRTKHDIKGTWSVINKLLCKSKRNPPQYILCNDKRIDDSQCIANEFNSYFINCCTNILTSSQVVARNDTFEGYLSDPLSKSLFLKPITESEILEITKSLKKSNSCGFDGINSNIVKKIIYSIVKPLCYIFNLSISTGNVPDKLKIAKIVPVYKKNDSHLCKNYRPISILPCFSKILEKCMYKRLYSFLIANSILTDSQYGFRSNHSTCHALIDLQDKIVSSVKNNDFGIGIFIDLSKAFDIVNHDILLCKLQHYGVHGLPLIWFKNYLCSRYQFTIFNDASSTHSLIKHGVPQGSILGPLLFLIYVNDIEKSSTKFDFIMYADDTTLFFTQPDLKDMQENINVELHNISKWFKANKLILNLTKTCFISFHNKLSNATKTCNDLTLSIDSTPITKSKSICFLGVNIDENLKWDSHINYLSTKISKCIGIMYKLRSCLPGSALFSLYNALILSHILYCITVWGNCSKTKLDVIFKLQKRAIRICTGSHYLTHSAPLFHKLNTLNIFHLYQYHTILLGYFYFKSILPKNIVKMFTINKEIHSHGTRNSSLFHLWKVGKTFVQRSVRYSFPTIWNSLPNYICSCISLSLSFFKRKLKQYFISKYA